MMAVGWADGSEVCGEAGAGKTQLLLQVRVIFGLRDCSAPGWVGMGFEN